MKRGFRALPEEGVKEEETTNDVVSAKENVRNVDDYFENGN